MASLCVYVRDGWPVFRAADMYSTHSLCLFRTHLCSLNIPRLVRLAPWLDLVCLCEKLNPIFTHQTWQIILLLSIVNVNILYPLSVCLARLLLIRENSWKTGPTAEKILLILILSFRVDRFDFPLPIERMCRMHFNLSLWASLTVWIEDSYLVTFFNLSCKLHIILTASGLPPCLCYRTGPNLLFCFCLWTF